MKPFLQWQRNEDNSREFFLDKTLPPEELTSAAIGIVQYGDSFVFTENHRWIEIPGWHKEPGESIEEALKREIEEETWATIQSEYIVIWYTKVHNKVKRPRRDGNGYYPFPYAYMAHFLTKVEKLWEPYGEETLWRHIVHKDEIHTIWLHNTAQNILQEVIKKYI